MRRSIALAFPVVLAVVACSAPVADQKAAAQKKEAHVPSENWKDLTDPAKAAHAPAVLRVKWLASKGGDKYAWDEVEVLHVIKNDSTFEFPAKLTIGYYNWESGIPKGESTVYIEPYNDTDNALWKLMGGSAKEGVSHSQ